MSRAKPANITAVKPIDDHVLCIHWQDHGEDIVDLSQEIAASPALASLREPVTFAAVRVGEYGWTASWDDDIELDAAFLYRLARYQARESLQPDEFQSWRARHGLSQVRAAEALGISDRMVKYYEEGRYMIPKTILLACRGYDVLHSGIAA